MLRRYVALLLLCFVAVRDAEGVLLPACDVGAEMSEFAADGPSVAQPAESSPRNAPAKDVCHCAHAHLQTLVSAERTIRVPLVTASVPIRLAEPTPASADRALLLRPPRA